MPKPNKVVPADDQQLRQQFKRIDDHHHANGGRRNAARTLRGYVAHFAREICVGACRPDGVAVDILRRRRLCTQPVYC